MGWIGGGDAKVAAAAALWFGFGHTLEYLGICFPARRSSDATAAPVPAMAIARHRFTNQDWLLRLHGKNTGIPYGIALTFAALLIYPETDWIRAVDLTRFGSPVIAHKQHLINAI